MTLGFRLVPPACGSRLTQSCAAMDNMRFGITRYKLEYIIQGDTRPVYNL